MSKHCHHKHCRHHDEHCHHEHCHDYHKPCAKHHHHHKHRHCYHHKMHHNNHRVCPPVPPTPPTPTTTYRCSGAPNYICGPVTDGTGYATLEECQANCRTPPTTYRCSGWPSYVCNPVTDGTGFATLEECQANCSAAPPVPSLLGSAVNFRVLAHSTITNTGATIINGDLGLSPGTSVVGFPPGTVIGTKHVTDGIAAQAQIDLTTAWNAITAMPVTQDLTGQDLGGMTLLPGVYNYDTSAQLTGNLILDAGGNTSAVWAFKIGSTLTTANVSSVTIINGGQADNVYWQVGSSATLGLGTQFVGNVLALDSITLTTGANISGRALARTAAVTLDTSIVAP